MGSGASTQDPETSNGVLRNVQTSTIGTQTVVTPRTAMSTQTDKTEPNSNSTTSAATKPAEQPTSGNDVKKTPDPDSVSLNSNSSVNSIFGVSVDKGFDRIRTVVERLKTRENYETEKSITDLLFLLNCTPNLDTDGSRDVRAKEYVEEMLRCGVMEAVAKITRKHASGALTCKEATDMPYLNLSLVLSFVMNASSLSTKVCDEIQRVEFYKDMFKLLDASRVRPEGNDMYRATGGKHELWENMVTVMIITLQICIQKLPLRDQYRACDAVRIFDMYRKSKNDVFKSMSELGFACVVMETEKELMIVDNEAFKTFKDILSEAIRKKGQTGGGSFQMVFQVDRIVDALNHLAVNDTNKVQFAKHGLLPYYVQLLDPDKSTEDEMIVATKGLYLLAFRVKDELKKEPGCIEGLRTLAENSSIKVVKDQAKGALWIIEGKGESAHTEYLQREKTKVELCRKGTMENPLVEEGHVMISYQGDCKPMLLRVSEKMREAGLHIWMQVGDSDGQLDKMAEAIEKASCVIICLSQKYKETPSCRLECEYASKRQKPIIPLLLQYRYDPDGWLGIIKGTKLHFDFSVETKFQTSVQGMLREINRLGENVKQPRTQPTIKEITQGPQQQPEENDEQDSDDDDDVDDDDLDNISLSSNASITSIFKSSLDDGLERLRRTIHKLHQTEDFLTADSITDLLFLLNCTPNLDTTGKRDKRARRYVKEMIDLKVMDIVVKVTRKYFDGALKAKKAEDFPYLIISLVLSFIMNGMSLSKRLCKEVIRTEYYSDMFKLLDTAVVRPENNDNYRSVQGKYELWGNIVTILIIGLQITIQRSDLREQYRKCDAIRIFTLYRKCENEIFKSMAELGFASVVMETEKDLMLMDVAAVETFQELLTQAMANHDKSGGGSFEMVFQIDKIVDALNQLAILDENKIKIAEHGLLKVYVKLLDPDVWSQKELKVATKGLYLLAFKVKDQIRAEPGCVDALTRLAETSKYKQVRDQAKGALWIIDGKMNETDHTRRPKTAVTDVGAGGCTMEGGHVMISYQWATKPTMIKVRDNLKQAGLQVWMDIDNMSGSLLDSMAEAVEKASVVIVCLTQKYKESPSCRLECEYASKRRKPFVTLRLQNGYDPDGWLGIITGTKFNFDFSNEAKFNTTTPGLVKQLTNIMEGKGDTGDAVQATLTEWSHEQIEKWLKEIGLEHRVNAFKKLTGDTLEEYTHLMDGDTQFFNKSLETEFKLSVEDIMTFRKALRKLKQ